VAKARADAEAADPGGFAAAESFGGARPGFSFRTGPLGTGYYRDAAAPAATPGAATTATPPKPPAERSGSRESSPAMRSRTMRASPPEMAPPPPLAAEGDVETERIGEQNFSLMGTFADNYDSDLLRDEPPPAETAPGGNSTGSGDEGAIGGGQFDEAASRASFLEALGDWRGGGDGDGDGGSEEQAQVWRNDAPDAPPPQQLPTQQSEPPPVGRCATPIECQTDASRPLARPSTAGAKRPGSAARKSYFEDLIAAKTTLSSPRAGAEERRAELQKLRAAKARQAEELAEMRKRNAELKATMEKENEQLDEEANLEKQAEQATRFVRECHSPRPGTPGTPVASGASADASVSPPAVESLAADDDDDDDDDEKQQPLAVPSPAMIALGLVSDSAGGSRPATPAERDAAKTVAREFTDMLFRPSSAPATRSPGSARR
jgi:hypothetical protein